MLALPGGLILNPTRIDQRSIQLTAEQRASLG